LQGCLYHWALQVVVGLVEPVEIPNVLELVDRSILGAESLEVEAPDALQDVGSTAIPMAQSSAWMDQAVSAVTMFEPREERTTLDREPSVGARSVDKKVVAAIPAMEDVPVTVWTARGVVRFLGVRL
jgi:hypothetical protein